MDSMCKGCLGEITHDIKDADFCTWCHLGDDDTQEQVGRLALNIWNLINEEGK